MKLVKKKKRINQQDFSLKDTEFLFIEDAPSDVEFSVYESKESELIKY